MSLRTERVESLLGLIDERLASLRSRTAAPRRTRIDQCRRHAAALRFHLGAPGPARLLTAIIGGTGTGKSTLINRIVESEISATSFRRTFTTGAVAASSRADDVPQRWLGLEHRRQPHDALPVRGESGYLTIVEVGQPVTESKVLVDTPDLDGDSPQHHAEADRVFRWAQAVVFLVTPEKYQMTELPGYYRLARRYALPCLFVMNKCEESAVLDDFRKQLAEWGYPDAPLFVIGRTDSAWQPPGGMGLDALREALVQLAPNPDTDREEGLSCRSADLLERLTDTVVAPLSEDRAEVDRLVAQLTRLNAAVGGIDVSPLTEAMHRRMREQSVLYLMGPARLLERARSVPGILARLPRTAWDFLARGELSSPLDGVSGSKRPPAAEPPEFARLATDQFVVIQSRIDNLLASSALFATWMNADPQGYAQTRLPAGRAGAIVDEQLAQLRAWLEQRRETAPRDTRVLQRLLGYIPGGERITGLSEAAPYLLALVVATHGAVFGPIDLLIIGGFSAATWLTEKLSDEVSARARRTNRQICQELDELVREQIGRVQGWLDQQAPAPGDLTELQGRTDEFARLLDR